MGPGGEGLENCKFCLFSVLEGRGLKKVWKCSYVIYEWPLRNANLFGRKLAAADTIIDNNESLCGEEVLYLDTNNKNQTSKIIQDQSCSDPDESNCIPQVYLQGYAMLFDQLHLDLKSRDKNSCNLDRKLATFEDALHVSEIFDAARHSFMEKSWMRIGSCSLNGGGNGNSGIAFEK